MGSPKHQMFIDLWFDVYAMVFARMYTGREMDSEHVGAVAARTADLAVEFARKRGHRVYENP